MINIRTFMVGAVVLNILALPLYFLAMVMSHNATLGDLFLNFVVPQVFALGGLFIFAKIWDYFRAKKAFDDKMLTISGLVFSVLVCSLIMNYTLNIVMDNSFQIKQGNYEYVKAMLVIPMGYYFACFGEGFLAEKIFRKR